MTSLRPLYKYLASMNETIPTLSRYFRNDLVYLDAGPLPNKAWNLRLSLVWLCECFMPMLVVVWLHRRNYSRELSIRK
jgi:hypothetical protein